jgi:hypothetical protein
MNWAFACGEPERGNTLAELREQRSLIKSEMEAPGGNRQSVWQAAKRRRIEETIYETFRMWLCDDYYTPLSAVDARARAWLSKFPLRHPERRIS